MSIDYPSVDKHSVEYRHIVILLSLEKEWSFDTCYNMDEPWRHYTVKPAKHKRTNTAWLHFCEVACCCSVAQSCLTLCDPMDCSTPGFPVLHHLQEFAQTLIHWVSDAIQPSRPLSSPSPPAFNLSQHRGLFQWVGSLHHVAKVLELQLQHQSFQWIFSVDLL